MGYSALASEEWLDIDLPTPKEDEGKPADATMPALPLGPQALAIASDAAAKREQFVVAWASLSDKQRVFLNTWRECRFNASKAMRVLANTKYGITKTTITNWLGNPSFEHVHTLIRSASVEQILNRDHLAARQEDIVETLLTPTPILHQGEDTGFREVQAASASKANEVLLRLGGHLKDKDLEVNVGIVGPSFQIQVMQPTGELIDVTPQRVEVQLPEPDADWTDV